MPPSLLERRREPRCPLHVIIHLVGREEDATVARDINTGGMRIECTGQLPPAGQTCQVRFRLHPGSFLAAKARILWAKRIRPGWTQAGLGFIDLPDAAQAAISRFVRAAAPEAI